jgi:hypothetical protein
MSNSQKIMCLREKGRHLTASSKVIGAYSENLTKDMNPLCG